MSLKKAIVTTMLGAFIGFGATAQADIVLKKNNRWI